MTSAPRVLPSQLSLIAVRHGSTDLTGRVLNGCGPDAADPELNEDGRRQVEGLRAHLSDWGWWGQPRVVWASTSRRAVSTAEILTSSHMQTDARLCEVDFGNWEGHTIDSIWRAEPELLAAWHRDPAFAPPGGTSLVDTAARVRAWREQAHAAVSQGDRVVGLVVAHASTIRILVADALQLPLVEASRITVGPAGTAIVNYWADGGSSLELLIPTPRPNG